MTNQPRPLPETVKAREYVIEAGNELETYQRVVINHEMEAARVVGVQPETLSYRIYGERVMWRLTFAYDSRLTNDEAKRAAFQVLVRCFGAYKPEFFKDDQQRAGYFVGVWFTNGSNLALKAINF